jgi:hypothetical protein
MPREPFSTQLGNDWSRLINGVIAPAQPKIRPTPITLYVELEDLLMEWRELWAQPWFRSSQNELVTSEWSLKDVIAHVASWTTEFRAQAEILAGERDVGYRILFEEVGGPRTWNNEQVAMRRDRPLDTLTAEIGEQTARLQDLIFQLNAPVLFAEHRLAMAMASSPDNPWIRSIAGIVGMRSFHDRHHINRIGKWIVSKHGGDF